MLCISGRCIRSILDRKALQSHLSEALKSVSANEVVNFPRSVVNTASSDEMAPLGFMPAVSHRHALLGYKAVSVFERNAQKGLNPHQGIVTLLDCDTGIPKALLNGCELTAVRTAAVSAIATMVLARPEANTMAIIGAGVQATEHVLAINEIRDIQRVHVCCRSQQSFKRFQDSLKSLSVDVCHFKEAKDAIQNVDIIVTCTPGHEVLFSIEDISPGCHINAIGACRPNEQEIHLADRDDFSLYVDSMEACLLESEEIISALKAGRLTQSTIVGELGDVLNHQCQGRASPRSITLFKSVGLSIEDVFAADYFYQQAIAKDLGQEIIL